MASETSDDANTCPLCCNKMISQDEILFFPCPCSYQVCAFCFDKLRNDLCPHCRTPYNQNAYRTLTVDEFIQQFPDRKLAVTKPRKGTSKPYKAGPRSNSAYQQLTKSELANTRVLQSNLVYVTGVPNSLSVDDLKSAQFFGKYGIVLKIVPKHSTYLGAHRHTHALYVTYSTEDSAKDCILSSTETYLGGNMLKCSFGTTKFCNAFLDGKHCSNKECMFLHELRKDHVVFTENDMITKKKFNEHTHPKIPLNRITYADNPGQLQGLPPSWEKEQSKTQQMDVETVPNKGTVKLSVKRDQDLKRRIQFMDDKTIESYTVRLANLVISGTSLFFPLPPCR